MKKSLILLIFLILPLVTAVTIDMKSDFNKGETITAKFSGNFIDKVSKENVFFYRGHVRVPMDFDIMNVGDDYYIYAINDKDSGNYSLFLENLDYYKEGQITDKPFSKNFTIEQTYADFSINPGFIIATNDFEIKLQNFQDNELIVNINDEIISKDESNETGFFESLFGNLFLSLTGSVTFDTDETDSITLLPNNLETLDFKIGNVPQPILKKITFQSENNFYEFLLYVPSSVKSEYSVSLDFEISELKISLDENQTKEEIVKLKNVGDELLKNITFEISNNLEPYVKVSKNEIYNLEVNQSAEIYLLFNSSNLNQTIQGELTARIPNETEDLVIIFKPKFEISNQTEKSSSTSKNCNELNGTLFKEPKICEGEERFAKDGNCCIGEIKEPEKSNTGLIIGWLIILVIIVFLIWFFKFKYKKSKGEIDLFKIARGKNN